MKEIAGNKAGIIKPNRPAVSVNQTPIGEDVIVAAAARAGAPLLLQNRDWEIAGSWQDFSATGPWGVYSGLRSGLAGDHQMQNAGAAIAALWAGRATLPNVAETAIRTGLAEVKWPGRYERIERAGHPLIVLDGAHTPASAEALAKTIRQERTNGGFVAVVGMFSDRDPERFLAALSDRDGVLKSSSFRRLRRDPPTPKLSRRRRDRLALACRFNLISRRRWPRPSAWRDQADLWSSPGR